MHSRSKIAGAIDVWENEGGAPAIADPFYGRRVEADKSWTVYHVFTGEVARIGGETMTGLSRSQATDRMMSLNHLNVLRKKERKARLRALAISIGAESRARL
jgi:hypothetical protein